MLEDILKFLEHPSSHALSVLIGMATCYTFIVLPIRKERDRLEKKLMELLDEFTDPKRR